LSRGGLCVGLRLGEGDLPLFLTGQIAFGSNISDGRYWGMLPTGKLNAAFDDTKCE
jgi:hypothetical protein